MSPQEDENYRGERRVGYHVKTNKKISWLRVWRREGGEGRSIWVHVTLPSDMRQIHMTYFCLQALVLCNFVWGLSSACKRRWLYWRALMTGWKKKIRTELQQMKIYPSLFRSLTYLYNPKKISLETKQRKPIKMGKKDWYILRHFMVMLKRVEMLDRRNYTFPFYLPLFSSATMPGAVAAICVTISP